ncbi:hypothetical protein NXY00_09470 [Bacteroides sp. BFG-551]|nr:hypothetical protein [Bacteroides sp. BFG-551]
MKKKIMGLIAVVAIAAIAGYNMLTSPNDVKLSRFSYGKYGGVSSRRIFRRKL